MTAQPINVEDFRGDLLAWYDKHRRVLPWRALSGETQAPYRVWLSEIMLQQTTVQAVIPYFLKFTDRWPDVHALAKAPSEEVMEYWAGLGYYARARNLHKCAQVVSADYGGVFPDTEEGLQELPGVGPYTAAAIAAIAFNRPANVVDGNVERVMARIHAVTDPVPGSKPQLKKLAAITAAGESARPGDYAQALMDLGATVCTPSSPKCMICPVMTHCAAKARGIAASLPARTAKVQKPQRHGYIYWIESEGGQILFERRAEKGLLGGTVGLPTSPWVDKAIEKTHLDFILKGKESRVAVRHGFTHFDLELAGVTAAMGEADIPEGRGYFWITREKAGMLGVPTVFRKALKQFI